MKTVSIRNKFDNLNDEQLMNLTPEEVEYYTDLACAEEGVPLLPPCPVKPDDSGRPMPDVQVWEVGEFRFTNRTDAERVRDFIEVLPRCTWEYVSGPRYDKLVKPTTDPVKIESEMHWSRDSYDANKAYLIEASRKQKEYEADKAEYDEVAKKRARIAEWINDTIAAAWERKNQADRILAEFNRYATLAEGDREMALKFFFAAYGDRYKEERVREVVGMAVMAEPIEKGGE